MEYVSNSFVVRTCSEHPTPIANKRNRTRFSGGDLISVGSLFKMDGGKDRDFIVFNEATAENSFGEVMQNETELSFYSK